MRNLKEVVDFENRMTRLFGKGPQIDLDNITQDVANALFERLDCNLSPEVLTCDGERSKAEIRKNFKLYTAAIAELRALGFEPTKQMYNF